MINSNSSLWRVSAMVLSIVVLAVSMMCWLTSWLLSQSLGTISRAVIEDDLGEYSVLYEKGGVEMIRSLYAAGSHQKYHVLRVLDAKGADLLSMQSEGIVAQNIPLPPVSQGMTTWKTTPMSNGDLLLLGGRGLKDGARIWFGRTDREDRQILSGVQRQFFLSAIFTAVISMLPVLWFVRRVLCPVRSFIESARILTEGDRLDERLRGNDGIAELREFARALNTSLDRVAGLTEELEAANDQLAHELRTPLARVRGNIDVVLAHYGEDAGREAAVLSIEEIERSTALIQAILAVRAGDTRSMRLHLEALSLKGLLTDICELYTAAAEQRELCLELLVTGDATVLVDRQRMQQAVSNLLDNALAYTPPKGLVTVLLDVEPDHATIHVRDTGPGVSETDHGRIWRRFMRGSAASANTPGIGLGLSLVKAVAHVHRGEAGVDNQPEGGADFWIRLPTSLDASSKPVPGL